MKYCIVAYAPGKNEKLINRSDYECPNSRDF